MGSAKSLKCTKALFELTNHCKKTIDKRNLIDQSVIKAAIFARSSCTVCFLQWHVLHGWWYCWRCDNHNKCDWVKRRDVIEWMKGVDRGNVNLNWCVCVYLLECYRLHRPTVWIWQLHVYKRRVRPRSNTNVWYFQASCKVTTLVLTNGKSSRWKKRWL